MPTVAPGSKVLVSGANGFIAVWVVQVLLEHGFAVRGTVRTAAKGEHLKKLFGSYGDKLEVVIVDDITKDGAFDEAVKGVDAIEHTASPFYLHADDPQELIKPAVHGTVGILQSALKYGTNVKRIVILSSCAAVVQPSKPPGTLLAEDSWNADSIKDVEQFGKDASGLSKYRASKTLAEKAAWDFVEKNKGSVGWDIVSLNPPMVFGPSIHEVSALSHFSTSVQDFANSVALGKRSDADVAKFGGCWIDVRDLALAHVRAITVEKAGGERFIIAAGAYVWQDWIDAAKEQNLDLGITLPTGQPGAGKNATHGVLYNNTKGRTVLGLEYRSVSETARDTLLDFKEKGLLQ